MAELTPRGRPIGRSRRWAALLATTLLVTALLGTLAALPRSAAAPDMPPPLPASRFLGTLGVNIHVGSDPYNDPGRLAAMLAYLGIRNVRQSSPIDAAGLATMQALGRLGARFDLIVNGGGPVNLGGAMRTVLDMAPYLNAVEGVNEAAINPISYLGKTGVDAVVALQKDLYRAVRAAPSLAGVPVYIFTLGGVDPGAFPAIGDLSAHTDFANVHSYPPHGLRPIFVIHAAIDGGRTSAPAKPVVLTETGYYTLPNHAEWGGVPERVQASYLLCLLLDEAAAGVARTYLYDLIDDGPDPQRNNREHRFGLFTHDGAPKPAATAIHNMTALLADHGEDRVAVSPLPFTAAGVPYNHTGNTLTFQKSDGTLVLAIWNEQQLWDPDTRTETPLRHIPLMVKFPRSHPVVQLYDPLVGTEPIETHHHVTEVAIDLTDHPLFLVLPGAACTAGARRPCNPLPR